MTNLSWRDKDSYNSYRDWLVSLCFREKLKIESHKTSLLGVECIEGHFAFVPKPSWILQRYFTIFEKKCLVRCVRTYLQILNISPVCTVSA